MSFLGVSVMRDANVWLDPWLTLGLCCCTYVQGIVNFAFYGNWMPCQVRQCSNVFFVCHKANDFSKNMTNNSATITEVEKLMKHLGLLHMRRLYPTRCYVPHGFFITAFLVCACGMWSFSRCSPLCFTNYGLCLVLCVSSFSYWYFCV